MYIIAQWLLATARLRVLQEVQQSLVARVLNLVVVREEKVLTTGKQFWCVETERCVVKGYHHLPK